VDILGNSICAIIISYNCDEKIMLGIENIKNQVDYIIIIDNGSKVESLQLLKNIEGTNNIGIIYNIDNMGIAYALNQGVKYAQNHGFTWIVTLDQDSIATNGMIKNMLNVHNSLREDQKLKILSFVPVHVEQSTYVENPLDSLEMKSEEIITDITSGNLIKVSLFDKVGYFDEKLFIDCVDHEFCFRMSRYGYKIMKVHNSILIHNLGDINIIKVFKKRLKSTNHSFIRRYYTSRNRHYIWDLYEKTFPAWVKNDKKSAFNDAVIIILFEKDKLLKIRMIIKGYYDFKRKKFGKLKLRDKLKD